MTVDEPSVKSMPLKTRQPSMLVDGHGWLSMAIDGGPTFRLLPIDGERFLNTRNSLRPRSIYNINARFMVSNNCS